MNTDNSKTLSGVDGEAALCVAMDSVVGSNVSLNTLRQIARAILAKYEVTPKAH